jgi:O-acetyl-ADP-ribose deacetylase (regulator of RNase III)
MINDINYNLLNAPLDAIAHFCNCQCVMGAGLALQFKKKYPQIYKIDILSGQGDWDKLGTITHTPSGDGKVLINCYTQYSYGGGHQTNYEAVYQSLGAVKAHLEAVQVKNLGLPYGAGCGLGGGDWKVVRAIIEEVFGESELKVAICRFKS